MPLVRNMDAREEYLRDKKLMEALDAKTEVPHLLVELRSLGYIEICGKDMGGIFARLEDWMGQTWGCEYMTTEVVKLPDPYAFGSAEVGWEEGFMMQRRILEDHDRLCDASYHWTPNELVCRCMPCCGKTTVTCFKSRGGDGENNMGKLSMQLVNFMTNTCGWGLKLLNGTNLGFYGQIREQQLKFKAPHPLNLIAPHLMIELRQAGYIEVNGPNNKGIYEKLEEWLKNTWKAKKVKNDPDYCDLKFACSAFKKRGSEGENNMGLRTMQIVDFMVQECAWTMITCNGGNYGRYGDVREQQMVFRDDGHVQHGEDHIMVELRDVGYVEVNGLSSSRDIEPFIDAYLKESWQCKEYEAGFWEKEKYCDRKYVVPSDLYYKHGLTNNIGKLTLELAGALASQGWMLALCNGGHTSSLKNPGNTMQANPHPGQRIAEVQGGIKREQQIKFTRARKGERADEPLLMIELRAVPADPPQNIQAPMPEMFRSKNETARLNKVESQKVRDWVASGRYQGLIEVNGLNTNGVYQKLDSFIRTYMRGSAQGATSYCDCLFTCNSFRQKMSPHYEFWDGYYCGENNFGKFTMRLCDYLVDHLGEWDLIVCNGNAAERAWLFGGLTSLVAREQQLVFRHRSGHRKVFMANLRPEAPLGRPPVQPPSYWKPGAREGSTGHDVVAATPEELRWMQELLDGTYAKKVTRDRRGGALADRFVAVAAVRSEHPVLWDAFGKRRAAVGEAVAKRDKSVCTFWARGRCKYGEKCRYRHSSAESPQVPKTMAACPELAARCALPLPSVRNLDAAEGAEDDEACAGRDAEEVKVTEVGNRNPANEAWLMHGTSPTSAVTILRMDFKIDLAGASAGTMFGPGAYLAERSSKADEYSQADTEGAYQGLYAMVVCRAVVGRACVVEKPGNYSQKVTSGEYDCVLGDREKAVGTYREFIFFSEDSIYPEYAVFYRREHPDGADEAAPAAAAAAAPADSEAPAAAARQDEPPPVPTAVPGRTAEEWQVVVPRGCHAGGSMNFKKPDGTLIQATVPGGAHPGSIVTVYLRG